MSSHRKLKPTEQFVGGKVSVSEVKEVKGINVSA